MRLYDFRCDECAKEFEDLVREVSDARCPKCGSSHVQKQLSAFAVGSGGATPGPRRAERNGCGGGSCGGGGCGMN
jgi:putative FmdB family regulatory protein